MYYTIYKIVNQIDGKVYIGSHKTKDLNDKYMGSGKYLKRAQEKCGIVNFTKEILFTYDNAQEMYAKEAELVNEDFLSTENTYNLKVGGSGGWDFINNDKDHYTHSSEHSYYMKRHYKEKMKDTSYRNKVCENISKGLKNKANNDPVYLEKKRKHIKNMSFAGKHHKQESKIKMSLSMQGKQSGEKNSQYGSLWITNGTENKKISKNDVIPNGWYRGRKIKVQSHNGIGVDC